MFESRNSSGITLLELMCAIVMTSFLILGLSQISMAVVRCKDLVDKSATECTDSAQLRHLLEQDLMNCRFLDFSPRRLTLSCFGSKAATGRLSWRPVVVVYEPNRVDGHWFLMRHEFSVMGERNRPSSLLHRPSEQRLPERVTPQRTDIVGRDIWRLDVLRFQSDDRKGLELAQGEPKWVSQIWDEHQVKSMGPPHTLRIQIYRLGMDEPWMDDVFCTRLSAER